jgi:hypothetical protein
VTGTLEVRPQYEAGAFWKPEQRYGIVVGAIGFVVVTDLEHDQASSGGAA